MMLLVASDAAALCLLRATEAVLRVRGEHLLLVALPMANVLAFTLLMARGRPDPRSRPFWIGATLSGATALLVFLCVAMAYPSPLYHLAIDRFGVRSDPLLPVSAPAFSAVFMTPLLLVALLGGLIMNSCRIRPRTSAAGRRTD